MEHLDGKSTNRSAIEVAARALGLDPSTLAFQRVRNVDVQPTLLTKAAPLTDEEWTVIGPLCPSEDRANSWSWRELIDVELWLLQPRNKLSFLSSANAHRLRKRSAGVRGDFDRLLEAMQRIDGLTEDRKGHLLRILAGCVKEAERFRAKIAVSEASTRSR